jgi:bifunctional DNA-binding transcriptional regulator/antitoxin component of YhaV-PrlF toxin-antitoxin module
VSTLTVTAKGQVTLRKDLLEHLGVHPGEKITLDNSQPDWVKAARLTGKISDLFGGERKRPIPVSRGDE